MNPITILNREITPTELQRMNDGFDELAVEEDLAIQSSDRFSFVAVAGDKFIGCSSGLAYKNGEQYSGWFYLTDLFVEKAHRSQGLGARLLLALEEEIAAVGVQRIWLWTSGEKALRFYHQQGYEQFAALEHYYSDGSSRVGLRKNL